MRTTAFALLLLALTAIAGCSDKPTLRSDPVEFTGTVKLPGGSPKDLTVTFQPQQNSLGTTAKVGADGSFKATAAPGKYVVYFSEESNARVPAFKLVPAPYRTPSEANTVSVASGTSVTIEVKQ